MRLLLTRPPGESREWSTALEKIGFQIACLPLIRKGQPADNYRALDVAITTLEKFQAILITSKTALEVFIGRLWLSKNLLPEKIRFFTVGKTTADTIQKKWNVDVVYPETGSGETDLCQRLESEKLQGLKVLWPRSSLSGDSLRLFFKQQGAEVITAEAYETKTDTSQKKKLQRLLEEGIDWIVFFSPSQVRAFVELMGKETWRKIAIAVAGPTTAEEVRKQEGIVGYEMKQTVPEDLCLHFSQISC